MINNAQQTIILEDAIAQVTALLYDVRAEVVVGELLDHHIREEEVMVQLQNVFTRSFTTDIIQAKLNDSQPYQPFISLVLSRDGIYDRLPQGIFHEFIQESGHLPGIDTMVARYKRQQQQQQQARRFFQPLENEFFLQRVYLEQREKHLLFEVFGKEAARLLHTFWQLQPDLPPAAANRLEELLPLVHRIAGNVPLMQLCLEQILDAPVHICRDIQPRMVRIGNHPCLGDARLGIDMMVGIQCYTDMPVMNVAIGPLKRQRLYDYLPQQPYGKLLDACYGYLFPVDVEINTLLMPFAEDKYVVMDDMQPEQAIIGYHFFL
ncbi:hypothetical protein ACDQ55_11055 [Chitinophaga sp. 30R24]|uniref:hypothetical protein n=1 Tax=Chitinophaga sp. 30R24 TaxID=3248838 RepID=UPI003B90965A